mgnify:CR=1 FL=1
MKLKEAQMEFIQTWGAVGSAWGIPRSMAQIHALLLSNADGLSTEEVMGEIKLSRGNVNINLRELINWGLISKQNKLGERKEFFKAEHEIWSVAKRIIEERKKREFVPIQNLLKELKQTKIEGPKSEVAHFNGLINELDTFLSQMDQLSDLLVKMKDNRFFSQFIKLLR